MNKFPDQQISENLSPRPIEPFVIEVTVFVQLFLVLSKCWAHYGCCTMMKDVHLLCKGDKVKYNTSNTITKENPGCHLVVFTTEQYAFFILTICS